VTPRHPKLDTGTRAMRTPMPALLAGGLAAAALAVGCGKGSTTASTTPSGQSTSQSASTSQPSTTTASPTGTTGATPSHQIGSGLVTASSGTIVATLRAHTHQPKVGRAWPIAFTVADGGHPARASVGYEYLFAGQVVAHRSHYTFTGHFADIFRWPSSAVGYPLTFRAAISARGATLNLDYPVQVSG
jgi:hypothetical protein